MNYQLMNLQESHGFVARRLAEHPNVGVLTAPSKGQEVTEWYHNAIRQMVEAGVRKVVVDVSDVESPRTKLWYAYGRPCSCEDHKGPYVELIPVVGITNKDVVAMSKTLRPHDVPGFVRTLDEAVANCLQN